MPHPLTSLICIICIICGPLPSVAQSWPQFRGPNQDGTSNATNVPTSWSEEENITWKTELPGKGWSSPVVLNDKIWLTTAIETRPSEAEAQKLLDETIENPRHRKSRQIVTNLKLQALCVDLESGKLEKTIDLFTIEVPEAIHTLNSYASPTPVVEPGRLYCDFGTFGTACVDTESGEVVWTKDLDLIHSVGPGSSPILIGNTLVLVRDGVDVQYIIALDKGSGEIMWRTPRPPMDAETGDKKKAYSTPIFIEHDGRAQLIAPTSQWIVSYNLANGEEFWRAYHGTGFSLVPRPVYSPDTGLVYVCTGFGNPELWAVDPSGSGDVSETHVRWTEPKRIPAKPSPLLHNDNLYVMEDGGVATCFNAADGEVIWEERVGGNFSASPILADDKIYFANHEGITTVLAAGSEYNVLAENQLDGQIMASPVPLDDSLLIRSNTALYKISAE
ncbi:MAG: PQQ-binding-like beta-propeller repeat protein [Verrucomicrobiota bacterium]